MNLASRRHRLAGFIEAALTPRTWHGLRLAAIPVPGNVLTVCGDAMRDLATTLRDEDRTIDAASLREIERVLTRGAASPLYDSGHPIRALHTLVAMEARFGHVSTRAA